MRIFNIGNTDKILLKLSVVAVRQRTFIFSYTETMQFYSLT